MGLCPGILPLIFFKSSFAPVWIVLKWWAEHQRQRRRRMFAVNNSDKKLLKMWHPHMKCWQVSDTYYQTLLCYSCSSSDVSVCLCCIRTVCCVCVFSCLLYSLKQWGGANVTLSKKAKPTDCGKSLEDEEAEGKLEATSEYEIAEWKVENITNLFIQWFLAKTFCCSISHAYTPSIACNHIPERFFS